MPRRILLLVVIQLFGASASAATNLSGEWELQSMGADRRVTIEQRGQKVALYRAMWPEFAGKKYKLEHLFKGTFAGARITGQLFVRDDETPHYEALRAFEGRVKSVSSIIVDGIELRRIGQAAAPSPRAAKASSPVVASPKKAPLPSVAPSPPRAATASASNGTPSDATASARHSKAPPKSSRNVPALVAPAKPLLDIKVKPALNAMAKRFMQQGDHEFKAGDFDDALSSFRRASRSSRGMPAVLLHRMGQTHLALQEYGQAYKWLYRAMRKDPRNPLMRREFAEADRRR